MNIWAINHQVAIEARSRAFVCLARVKLLRGANASSQKQTGFVVLFTSSKKHGFSLKWAVMKLHSVASCHGVMVFLNGYFQAWKSPFKKSFGKVMDICYIHTCIDAEF